jgi:hypothetical protein
MRVPASAAASLLGRSPDTCAENMIKGMNEVAKGDKNYGFINEKGNVFEKKAWDEDQVQKVKDHTWKILDEALSKA